MVVGIGTLLKKCKKQVQSMKKNILLSPMKDSLQYAQLIETLKNSMAPVGIYGISASQKSHIAYGLHQDLGRRICILTYSDLEAQQIYQDLKFYIKDQVLLFPTKDIVFYDIEANSNEMDEERIKTLNKLTEGGDYIVVASLEALLLKITPPEIYKRYQITLNIGKRLNLSQIIETFIIQGYERTEGVQGKGEFSIRGGIIDIFPPSEEKPIRIELFDDEIDSIRHFSVDTQKSIKKIEEIKIYPATEIIIESGHEEEAIAKLSQELNINLKKLDNTLGEKLQKR